MNAKRWQEVQATFDALLALDDAERGRRLTAIADSDPELHAAVQWLLAAGLGADKRLAPSDELLLPLPRVAPGPPRRSKQYSEPSGEPSALQLADDLNATLAGRYRITREIGSGGMAIVYQAQDLRHDRLVALKVLNPELGAILGAKRFLEEIRVTANLQHPNLLPLFDSGEADGLLYYVMPYVEGESLRARLNRELQLPIEEAVHIAVSVAGALDYAHSHGVIHRDLKPENILLQRGEPMVADFGIALAVKRAGGERVTESGISLGTPRYMSPEQASADRTLDGRSDVYSLGVVLYEMLIGEPPHTAPSAQGIIAKVLTEPVPSVRVRRPSVPEQVATAIACALEKVPADRWQTAGTFADALMEGRRVTLSQASAAPSRAPASERRSLFFGVGVACGLAAALLIGARLRLPTPAPFAWYALVLPESLRPRAATDMFFPRDLALSTDGSALAYVTESTRALAVRHLDELEPRLLAGTDGAKCPSFSPDGRWLLYIANQRLFKVPVTGGSPIAIATDSNGTCGVWTDRDEVIFEQNWELFRVPAEGGIPVVVARPDRAIGYEIIVPTQALPGGHAVLVEVSPTRTTYDFQVALVSIPDGKITRLTEPEGDPEPRFNATYSQGQLVFQHGRSIVAAPFSLRSRRITGGEVTILRDTVYDFTASPSGDAVYRSSANTQFNLVAVALDGRARVVSGRDNPSPASPPAAMDTAQYAWPRLSPDGKRVALEMSTGLGSWDIFIYDLATSSVSRLTTNFSGIRPMAWTPDLRLVYLRPDTANITAPRHLVSQAWDGSSPASEMFPIPPHTHDVTLGPPHTYAVISETNPPAHAGFILVPLDTAARARRLLPAQASEEFPRISPNGRLLAYAGDDTRRGEIYVRPLPSGQRIQVSTSGGSEPVWSPDGEWLYYREDGYVSRARIGANPTLAVLRRDRLFKDVYEGRDGANYDIFPGGKELLLVRARRGRAQIGVIENWPELLRRRAVLH